MTSEPYTIHWEIFFVAYSVKRNDGYRSCSPSDSVSIFFKILKLPLQLGSLIARESGVGSMAQCEVIAYDDELRTAPTKGLVIRCGDIDFALFG